MRAGNRAVQADQFFPVVNRAKVAQMSADGLTTRQIGEELCISAASVCRILNDKGAAAQERYHGLESADGLAAPTPQTP